MGTLDFLELRYRVEWPVNIVITEKSVVRYNKVSRLSTSVRTFSQNLKPSCFPALNKQVKSRLRWLLLTEESLPSGFIPGGGGGGGVGGGVALNKVLNGEAPP